MFIFGTHYLCDDVFKPCSRSLVNHNVTIIVHLHMYIHITLVRTEKISDSLIAAVNNIIWCNSDKLLSWHIFRLYW